MQKFFVLDTNILLNSPNAIFAFDDNFVIITEAVLEELDSFKKDKDDRGVNARVVTRELENLRKKGSLTEGTVINDNRGILKIESNHKDVALPDNWNLEKADHRILQVCIALKNENKDVHLVTNDILLRIKGDIIGIPAEGFETEQTPETDKQYTGRMEVYVDDEHFDLFYHSTPIYIPTTDLFTYDSQGNASKYSLPIYPNEYVLLRNSLGTTALGKVSKDCKFINSLQFEDYNPYGIKPKNVSQRFMIDALMSDTPLTVLKGPGGTAKTLLSLACGLDRVIDGDEFRRILVCRPAVGLGGNDEIGFLPGTEKEKINVYMRPIYDNLEVLVDSNEKERYNNESSLQSKVQYILDKGYIDMQAVSFLRGRSISKQFMLIDECIYEKNNVVTDKGLVTIGKLYEDWLNHVPLPKALSLNEETRQLEYKQITGVVSKGNRDVIRIKVVNLIDETNQYEVINTDRETNEIICTGNHLFLAFSFTDLSEWKRADELSVGDYLISKDNLFSPKTIVTKIDNFHESLPVYDISVEDNHNFLISGTEEKPTKNAIVVHNCQNLTPSQARAVVTRVGEGTKLVMCGDPQQIDTPFLDSTNNGLSFISERMKGSPYCVQVTAKKSECVRSKLAEDAIGRLMSPVRD